MEVGVGVGGEIVVDGEIDALDIDTTTEDVGGDTDTLVELLELLVTGNTKEESARCSRNETRVKHTAPPEECQNGQQSRGSCTPSTNG